MHNSLEYLRNVLASINECKADGDLAGLMQVSGELFANAEEFQRAVEQALRMNRRVAG